MIVDRFTLLETSMTLAQVSQRMQVRIVSLAALEASGPNAAVGTDFIFSILLDLSAGSGSNGLEFRITYAGIENETLPEAALTAVNAWLDTNRPFDRTVPLDLTALLDSLGLAAGTTPLAGVTSNSTAVALRIDFSPTPNPADWATFSAGNFDDLLVPEQNFALYVDKDLLLPGIQNQVNQQLAGQLSVNSVSVQWLPLPWGARFHVDIDATAVDACDTLFFGAVDVDVDIDIDIEVSMSGPDMLRNRAEYSFDVDNWDTIKCGLALSFGLSPDVLIDVMLFLVPAFGFWGPIYGASTYTPAIPEKPKCTQGEQTINCTQQLKTPQLFGPSSIQGLAGLANGLLFLGTLDVPPDVVFPVIASVSPHGLGFTVAGPCGGLKIEGNGGGIDIEYDPPESGTICSVTPRPGSEDYKVKPDGNNRVDVTYPFGEGAPTEPCRILLQTTGGARIVDLGVPPKLTAEVQEQMEFKLGAAQSICDKKNTVDIFSWFDDLFWQQVGSAQDVLFHVIVGGGKPGDRFTVTSGGDLIGTMTAPRTGGSEFGTFVTLGKDKPVLTIPAGSRASARLFLMGTVLERVGSIRTPFAPTDVRFGFGSGELVVTIADEIQSQTFSLHQPRFPLFLRAGGPLLSVKASGDARAVPARMQTRRDAFFVARPNGGGDVLDNSEKRPRVLASYVGRPWFVATDRKGRFVAHSLRNETIIYRVAAVHREEFSFDPDTKPRPRPPVDRPK